MVNTAKCRLADMACSVQLHCEFHPNFGLSRHLPPRAEEESYRAEAGWVGSGQLAAGRTRVGSARRGAAGCGDEEAESGG